MKNSIYPCPVKSENQEVVKGVFVVLNDKGLHTRPSTEIIRCAMSYRCHVNLMYKNKVANARSLLSLLMLAAPRGAKVTVEAKGEDAELAVAAFIELAQNKFNYDY